MTRRGKIFVLLASMLSVSLLGVGGWQLWQRHQLVSGTATSLAPATVGGRPLDERPVPLSSCTADDDQPRTISLGSLDVEGCIQPVGRTGDQMEAPGNIHVAGWYTGSAKPGTKGLSIIDGHSSGRYKDGIFNDLSKFEDGSVFTVEYGDGTAHSFAVTSVRTHRIAQTMARLRSDARSEDSDIALITCGGDYDAVHHSYDRRVVVLAVAL